MPTAAAQKGKYYVTTSISNSQLVVTTAHQLRNLERRQDSMWTAVPLPLQSGCCQQQMEAHQPPHPSLCFSLTPNTDTTSMSVTKLYHTTLCTSAVLACDSPSITLVYFITTAIRYHQTSSLTGSPIF